MPYVPKHIAALELSVGAWNDTIDENNLSIADKELISNNPRIIAYYPSDQSPEGPPEGYTDINSVDSWIRYAQVYGNQDAIDIRYGLRNLLDSAVGETEVDRLATFTKPEQDQLIINGANVDDNTGINYYSNEEGFDSTLAQSFHKAIKIKFYDNIRQSCGLRDENRYNLMTLLLTYYAETNAIRISDELNNNAYDPGLLQPEIPISFLNNYIKMGIFGTQWNDSQYGILDYIWGNTALKYELKDVPLLPGFVFSEVRDALTEYLYTRWTT